MIHAAAPLGESADAQKIGLCGNRHIVTLNDQPLALRRLLA
jgi:hypothetical protein